MSRDGRGLTLSLISHTNVGKTTLVRTLLRRDVGEVRDQPHVTDENEQFVLAETAEGRAVLWDTPGFGDSARLLRRLRSQHNPLSWMLSQVWDRFADRPLWCSQQAVKNAREEADVILYLVNAAEDPALAGYVDAEMQILDWIGRPVVVLLNQTGAPRGPDARRADEARWRAHVASHPVVRDVVDLDALSRCWVQEGVLLERIRAAIPAEGRPVIEALIAAWRDENLATFGRSMNVLARLLAAAASDGEPVPRGARSTRSRRQALERLGARLDSAIHAAIAELVTLQGLEGTAAAEIKARLADVSAPGDRPEPWKAGVVGGIAGGALGGLAADLAAGGLTFGAGTVLGALLGAMGVGGLAWGYQMLEGEADPRVTWSDEFLARQARDGLLRYLAVAHFGRGAGEYRDREQPALWRAAADRVLARRAGELKDIWRMARSPRGADPRADLVARLAARIEAATAEVLAGLYPEAERLLERPR
jgi:hypothetical protein